MDGDKPEGYLDELVEAMYYLEQPQRLAVDVPFYLLAKTVRDNNHKVVYSGEGADEILGVMIVTDRITCVYGVTIFRTLYIASCCISPSSHKVFPCSRLK